MSKGYTSRDPATQAFDVKKTNPTTLSSLRLPFPHFIGYVDSTAFFTTPLQGLELAVDDPQAFGLGYCMSPFQGLRALRPGIP